jgi:hypothetical protein
MRLILKRARALPRRGRPHHEGGGAGGAFIDVDARLRPPRKPHADAQLRGDARGRDGGVREELAAGMTKKCRVNSTRVRPKKSRLRLTAG